jgi:glycosyltransferase involved in cell wall biosynthesis
MIRGKSISLVIPCRNEEQAISALLKRVPKYVDEVIVVDNNSSDKTRQVARSHGAKVLKETRQVNGIGYGFAHQRGMAEASGDFVITMDGDNTYPLTEIRSVILNMEKNQLDFISCNRFPLKNSEVISKVRQFGVKILNTQVNVLYNYPIQDILSGMWAVRSAAIEKLNLKQGGWNFSPEIKLAALIHPDIKFSEFHIHHHYRDNGESKQKIWLTGFDHLLYILLRRLTVDNPVVLLFKQGRNSLSSHPIFTNLSELFS